MGNRLSWDELLERALYDLMRAPSGSDAELLAAKRLREMQGYAQDMVLMGRLREGRVEP